MTMTRIGQIGCALAIAGGLAGCDLAFDPGPPKASTGQVFLFNMAAVRPALPVCADFDAAFTRNHVVTVSGERAQVKSDGGIDTEIAQVAPGIYRAAVSRDSLRIVVSYDQQNPTRTLIISEITNGCRWAGESRSPDVELWRSSRWPTVTDWWR